MELQRGIYQHYKGQLYQVGLSMSLWGLFDLGAPFNNVH